MDTRDEHLAWCRKRALEYLNRGDLANAILSMISDLEKHPDTRLQNPYLARLGIQMVIDNDLAGARRFIEGFR